MLLPLSSPSIAVPTTDGLLPTADNAFASILSVLTKVGTVSVEAPAAATTVARSTLFSWSYTQGNDSFETAGPTVFAPVWPGSAPPATRSRRPTASPLGRADVQQQQLAMHPLLSTMALGPAEPIDHPPGVLRPRRESHGRGRPRPRPRHLLLSPRRSTRYRSRRTATAESLCELLSYDFRFFLATRRQHLQS